MRAWVALSLFLVISCADSTSGPPPIASTTRSLEASPSSQPSPVNETYPPVPGCPAQPDYSGRAFGVLVAPTPSADGTFALAVVDTSGAVVARAAYHSRQYLNVSRTVYAPVFLGAPVSTSNSRLYYLDGNNDVRWLAPDGSTGLAVRLPGDDHVRSAFAVSPDDRRIAVSVIDYSVSPQSLRLYVEDLGTGANHVQIFASTSTYVWPVGWHSCRLVVGVGERVIDTSRGNPFNPYGASSYHVLDATSADRLATIGDSSCLPTGPIGPGGIACASPGGNQFSVLDWTGQPAQAGLKTGGAMVNGAAVSPDGTYAAICCSMAGVVLNLKGGVVYSGTAWGWPMWIDQDHVLASGGSENKVAPVVVRLSGLTTPVDASGYPAATIPGSL